ncbi:MAG: hypothetical protein U9Q15_04355, partial [Patescibacteria group bacterium]|nr:hypothetical protein [Patescibacteria group bacterium]
KSFENLDYVSMDFDFDTTEEGLKRTLTVKVYDISYVMDHVYPVVSVISEIQKQELAKEFIEEYFPLLLDLCHTTIHAWEKRRENKASKYRVEDNRARALAGIITKREEREKELNKSIEQKEQELVDIDSTIKPSELAYNKNVLVISERVFPNIPDRFKNLIEVNPRIALDQLLQVNNLSALEYVVRRGSVLGSDMYQGSYALHWNQLTFSWMGDPCPSSDMAQFSAAKQVCLQTVFER